MNAAKVLSYIISWLVFLVPLCLIVLVGYAFFSGMWADFVFRHPWALALVVLFLLGARIAAGVYKKFAKGN